MRSSAGKVASSGLCSIYLHGSFVFCLLHPFARKILQCRRTMRNLWNLETSTKGSAKPTAMVRPRSFFRLARTTALPKPAASNSAGLSWCEAWLAKMLGSQIGRSSRVPLAFPVPSLHEKKCQMFDRFPEFPDVSCKHLARKLTSPRKGTSGDRRHRGSGPLSPSEPRSPKQNSQSPEPPGLSSDVGQNGRRAPKARIEAPVWHGNSIPDGTSDKVPWRSMERRNFGEDMRTKTSSSSSSSSLVSPN